MRDLIERRVPVLRPIRRLRGACLAGLAVVLSLVLAGRAGAQRTWVQHGPRPNTLGQVEGMTDQEVVGAVQAVAAHPTNANVVFVGAVNGGIWRTGNATAAHPTWVEQLGLTRALSIGTIEFDPTDAGHQTLLAGAGRFSNFYSVGGDRVGTWRTTDGGTTWTLLDGSGTLTGLNVSGVAPRGATLVLSANATGSAAGTGIWRSTNTGGAWTRISGLAGTGLPGGKAYDLASDPSNTARLFTNAGTTGIYRSIDTGANWAKVSDAAVDAALVGASNVDIAVGSSNNVYVAIVIGGRLSSLFRSPDAGATWAALDVPTTTESGVVVGIHPGNQGSNNLSLAADATDANVVYIAGDRQPALTEFTTGICPCWPNSIGANTYSGRVFRVNASLAAGTQAVHITHTNTTGGSSPHADSRAMAIDANGDLLETDDGGIYRRSAPRTNAGDWTSVNGDLQVTEFHDIAWDHVSKILIGGAQDTGTPEEITPAAPKWRSVSTGDGGDVAVDDISTAGSSIRYSSYYDLGNFRRRTISSTNAVTASVYPALTVVGGGAALSKSFRTPIAVNGVTGTRLLIGGSNSVYESTDQGATITEIGAGVVVNAGVANALAYGATGNAEAIYLGSGDRVFVRTAAAPAALTASATYPGAGTGRQVVDVVIDPRDAQSAYAVDATHVYRTINSGGAWTDVTGDLMAQTPGAILSTAFSTSNADGSVIVGAANGVFIARGPTFTAWLPVASGLPRAPVYDIEYDATDQVLAAGLFGRGAWTVNLDERDPVDVALVLDLSGSMLSPACATCSPKLDVLKDAVELFVQLFTVFTLPDDRFSLNYFRTTINEFLVGGSALFPAQANAAAAIADLRSQTTVGSNLTAMGGGIQQAINRLTDATRPRNILVFTDGMQNVNPMVNTTTFVIENGGGWTNSNVNPTVPPTDLNAALGIKVNTIGVGATPSFVDLLDDIATETHGLFKLTTAPDEDLRRFYVEELVDVLRQFSPQLVAYRYGAVGNAGTSESFTTDGGTRRVVLKLSWKRGIGMDLAVFKDGVDVTRSGRIIRGDYYAIFVMDVPGKSSGAPVTPAGVWRMQIMGQAGAPYEAAAIVEEERLDYQFSVGEGRHLAGAPLPLLVRLKFDGQPVTDARVTARVLSPSKSAATLLSTRPTPVVPVGFKFEPGVTVAQKRTQVLLDQAAFRADIKPVETPVTLQSNGDGTYTASVPTTLVTGAYTVIFRVQGQRAGIGSYDRTESRSVSVRFGMPMLATSGLRLARVGRGPGGDRFDLVVRPVDEKGNYLGPDYGQALQVRVDGVLMKEAPVDRLDGSYAFRFATRRPPTEVKVAMTVMGRLLYEGTLSGISRPK